MKGNTKWLINDIINIHHFKKFDHLYKPILQQPSLNPDYLPNGDHLLFFNPGYNDLNSDGYFCYQTPSSLLKDDSLKFKRRLWAQGSMAFYQPIQFNQEYYCQEKIKFIKQVNGSHYVCIERLIAKSGHEPNTDNLHLKELRTLAYTNSHPVTPVVEVPENVSTIGEFTISELDIVRYGQLSSNPHRIHWDRGYCQDIEGYTDIIAQGPFLVQIIMKSVSSIIGNTNITNIKYKNIKHVYAGTRVEISICKGFQASKYNVWLTDGSNVYVSMEVTVSP